MAEHTLYEEDLLVVFPNSQLGHKLHKQTTEATLSVRKWFH